LQGWLSVRKEDNDSWKKRWGVLCRNKLIFYDTVLCQVLKEEIELHGNMQVEVGENFRLFVCFNCSSRVGTVSVITLNVLCL